MVVTLLASVPFRLSSSLFPVIISYEQLTILSGSGGSACTSTRPAASAAFLILLLCLLVITTTTISTANLHRNAIVDRIFCYWSDETAATANDDDDSDTKLLKVVLMKHKRARQFLIY